jgi:hypothetical protein
MNDLESRVSTLERITDVLNIRVNGVEVGMDKLLETINKATWRIIGGMGVIIMFLIGIIYKL